jgi:CDP-glucose 4,6-dehydratase
MESMVNSKDIVLITGGAGFIGSHIVELLIKKFTHIVVVDKQKPNSSYFFLNHLDKKVEYRILDIRKNTHVQSLFTSVHPTYVIHLAAQAIVPDAYENPYESFETNIMGTVHVLEACRKQSQIKRIIVASSDKAYGKSKNAYTEITPLHGDHPYDVSKTCEDLIAQSYYKTYGMPVVITRFGNVYGEGDMHFGRIIPGICKSLISHTPLQIRSNGKYIRDYLYVKDVATGYVTLLSTKKNIDGESYNFSSKDTWSVLEVVHIAERVIGKKIMYKIVNTSKNEIPYQHLKDNKIRKIGWKSVYSLHSTFVQIHNWYSSHM